MSMNFDNIVAERKNKTIYRDGDKCVKVSTRPAWRTAA